MNNFKVDRDADGIASVTFDVPGRSMNVISAAVQRDLTELVAMIVSDDSIRGAVLVSGKPNGFCVGADLTELPDDIARWRLARDPGELAVAVRDAGSFSQCVRAIETCGKPFAAVIGGIAVGGGLELALGCHYRVMAADPAPRLALPEATLGLMPGGGGTQRLIRLMGLNGGLVHILDGVPIPVDEALATGVIHAIVPAEAMVETARRWILDGGSATAPWDAKGFRIPGGGPHGPAGYGLFGPQVAARRAAAFDADPATGNILKALYEGAQVPIDAALRIEARYFYNTACAPGVVERVEAFNTAKK